MSKSSIIAILFDGLVDKSLILLVLSEDDKLLGLGL